MKFDELSFTDTTGKTFRMSDFHGNVRLIVNTATKCGLAPQFEELEKLHQKYREKGLVIIGFPSNQFMNQEPESDATMAEVCNINFGVTFLLSQKINVNGQNTHPVFDFLKKKLSGGFFGNSIKWNFTKFLITREGQPYRRYAPTVKPFAIENDIGKLLSEDTRTTAQ